MECDTENSLPLILRNQLNTISSVVIIWDNSAVGTVGSANQNRSSYNTMFCVEAECSYLNLIYQTVIYGSSQVKWTVRYAA